MQGTKEAVWTELEWKPGCDGGSREHTDPSGSCQGVKEQREVQIRDTEEKMRLRREEGPQGCRGSEGRSGGDTNHDHGRTNQR